MVSLFCDFSCGYTTKLSLVLLILSEIEGFDFIKWNWWVLDIGVHDPLLVGSFYLLY